MRTESTMETASVLAPGDRREFQSQRVLGHLVSLSGLHGVIACDMQTEEGGDYWSVGNLITIVHSASRLVGVVCELMTADQRWNPGGVNQTLVKVELSGEIIDEQPGKPVFYRGIRSFPTLGAVAHRMRAGDLRAIYSIRGEEGVEIGRLTQNPTIPATVSVAELTKRHFAVLGSTGVGKSTAVSMLLKQCIHNQPSLRVLILDPHNEYASHFKRQAVILDSDTLELPYWMFRFDEMLDIIYAGRKPNSDEADALYEVIRAAKVKFSSGSAGRLSESSVRRQSAPESGWVSADTPIPYRISDVVQLLDEWMGKLDPRYARADLAHAEEPPGHAESRSPLPLHVRQAGRRGHHGPRARPYFPPAQGRASRHDHPARRVAERSRQFRRVGARAHGVRGRRLEPADPIRSRSCARKRIATSPPT